MDPDQNLNRSSIVIGYYDPFSVFSSIEHELLSQFPLKKLAWKYDPDKPIKVIQELDVTFKEEIPKLHRRNFDHDPSKYVPDRTYLRIMFVSADSIDVYRSQARPLINEWLKAFVAARNVAWAIVYVSSKNSSDKRPNLVKSSPFDKLIMDFEKGKQLKDLESKGMGVLSVSDNILRVKKSYDDNMKKLEAFKELSDSMRNLILVSFTLRLTQLLNDVDNKDKREFLMRNLELADAFADMCFFDDASRYYKTFADEIAKSNEYARNGSNTSLNGANALLNLNLKEKYDLKAPELVHNADFLVQSFLTMDIKRANLLPIRFGIFLKTSSLMHSRYRQNDATVNVMMCHIKLLQNLSDVVNVSLCENPKNNDIKEWLYVLVDYYLSTKSLSALCAPQEAANTPKPVQALMEELSQAVGELKLTQRNILNDFAIIIGYELLNFHSMFLEVSLDPSAEKLSIEYPKLKEALKSKTSFMIAYENVTRDAINDFLSGVRTQTADLLSIDSAMIHYKKGEFHDAQNILASTYEHYLSNGWSMIGGIILETYLNCVQKSNSSDPEKIIVLYFKLFLLLKTNSLEDVDGVRFSYKSIKSNKECETILEELCQISMSLEHTFEQPLLELFSITVLPTIAQNKNGECTISLILENDFLASFKARKMFLVLANMGNDRNTISFSTEELKIQANSKSEITLSSPIMRVGEFTIQSIAIELTETLILIYKEDLLTGQCMDTTILEVKQQSHLEPSIVPDFASMNFLMVPHPDQFHVALKKPAHLDIRKPSLDCIIYNGPLQAENIRITILKSSEGIKLIEETEPRTLPHMDAASTKTLCFEFPGERELIELQLKCLYEIEGREYEFSISDTFDLNLDVSIVVNDIFRMNTIYSRFRISTVDSDMPLRITDCEFTCPNGSHKVKSLLNIFENGNSLIVSVDQPANMFYQVDSQERDTDCYSDVDMFDFRLTYSPLKTECESMLLNALRMELKEGGFLKYFFIFAPLISRLEFSWNDFILSEQLLARNKDEMNTAMNERIKKYLPYKEHPELIDILHRLLENVPKYETEIEAHQLYIPVEAPSIDVLHEVKFDYDKKCQFEIGKVIETELIIKSSSKWAKLNASSILASSSPGQVLWLDRKFSAKVHDDDNWLLTGNHVQNFTVREPSVITKISISLLPVKSGNLTLPKVSVNFVEEHDTTMDVVYENSLETVLVVPELETITFSL